jgi:hypothetical protein
MDGGPGAVAPDENEPKAASRLITRARARQIFQETTQGRFDVVPEPAADCDALYDTLSRLMRKAARKLARPEARSDQAAKLGRCLSALQEAMSECAETRFPPPPLPASYVEKLELWIDAYSTPFLGTGRPPSDFNFFVYPRVLAFYSFAFGREPSASPGPTHRFLNGCISAVRERLGKDANHQGWAELEPETIKKQVPQYLSASHQERGGAEVRRLFMLSKKELGRA